MELQQASSIAPIAPPNGQDVGASGGLSPPAAAIPTAETLAAWVALAGEEVDGTMVLRIVDEAESADLNLHYRGQSGATNVLSFPFEAPPECGVDHLGDVVICAPVLVREAEQQGKPLLAHWAHIVIHGVLHLRGFTHDTPKNAAAMERREIDLLARLGFPNPYEVL